MRKPRMTKSEKAFMEKVGAMIFAQPEIRNGQKFMDRKAFAMLSKEVQDKFWELHLNKTR
jgi:hypothetical protein